MNNKLLYVTVFPELSSVHLKKDVGMIPYEMGKKGYSFKIVSYQNDLTYEQKKQFHVQYVPRGRSVIKDFSKYILKNGKDIDILNIYHLTSNRNVVWSTLYKLVNNRGIIHLKLDADYRMINILDNLFHGPKGKIIHYIYESKVDLFTVESKKFINIFQEKWNIAPRYLTNGFWPNNRSLNYDKKNFFLTVGRLGDYQKATDTLLEAFAIAADKIDWDLYLIGNVEEKFADNIKAFYEIHSGLKTRVHFLGEIKDANILSSWYENASVFVLPSRWESFALVLVEALERGDFLITSDSVPSSDEIGNHGKFCETFKTDDVQGLAEKMISSATRQKRAEIDDRHKWVVDHYSWNVIINELDNYIKEILDERSKR